MDIVGNQPVARCGRVGNEAGYLRCFNFAGQEREWHRLVITPLLLEAFPVDSPPVEPGGRSRLEAAELQASRGELPGEAEAWRLAMASRRYASLTDVNKTVQEGSRGEDDGG